MCAMEVWCFAFLAAMRDKQLLLFLNFNTHME